MEISDLHSFDLDCIRKSLSAQGMAIVRGQDPMERSELVKFALKLKPRPSQLLSWDFGEVMEMKVASESVNYLFSHEKVPFHWDGAFKEVPHYLVFNCIEAPDIQAGGETLFCHTQKMWQQASEEDKKNFEKVELTYSTEKLAHYGGDLTTKMVQTHPENGEKIIRYAEPVSSKLNPVFLKIRGVASEEEFVSRMEKKLYDPKFLYQHRWQRGDLLICDNYTFVHGRNAFSQHTPRHLRRVQVL